MEKLALKIGTETITAPPGIPTEGRNSLSSVLQVGFGVLIVGAIFLALIYLIWGGFDWIASEGNKQKLDQARQKVVFAIIGLFIVFISFLIINLVQHFFEVRILTIPGATDVPCSTSPGPIGGVPC